MGAIEPSGQWLPNEQATSNDVVLQHEPAVHATGAEALSPQNDPKISQALMTPSLQYEPRGHGCCATARTVVALPKAPTVKNPMSTPVGSTLRAGQYVPEPQSDSVAGVAQKKPGRQPRSFIEPSGQFVPDEQVIWDDVLLQYEPVANIMGNDAPNLQ